MEDRTQLLKATPFLLYIFKRSRDTTISPQMVVLYWEDQSPSMKAASYQEPEKEQNWRITECKIPVSFDRNTESVAFAVAYVTSNSVEFIEHLSCVVNPHELNISDKVKVENTQQQSTPTVAATPDDADTTPSVSHLLSESSSSSSSSLETIPTPNNKPTSVNSMVLHMEKKGSLFLEISELSIVLKPDTVKRVCQAFKEDQEARQLHDTKRRKVN